MITRKYLYLIALARENILAVPLSMTDDVILDRLLRFEFDAGWSISILGILAHVGRGNWSSIVPRGVLE